MDKTLAQKQNNGHFIPDVPHFDQSKVGIREVWYYGGKL